MKCMKSEERKQRNLKKKKRKSFHNVKYKIVIIAVTNKLIH